MGSKAKYRPNPKLKLMEQVREVLRYYHYAYKTEQAYCWWIVSYIRFFGNQMQPCDLGPRDVERFLSDLAVRGKVSASTQHQALNALVFLCRQVLDKPLDDRIQPIGLQKAVKLAARRAGIHKRVTCHTLRHSFATAMLENGTNICVLQDLMGHAAVKTTERYTHMMDKDISRLTSLPLTSCKTRSL